MCSVATHVQVCPLILHLHSDTSSSVNSTGWTGCQGKDQRISMFSGGRMVSCWTDISAFTKADTVVNKSLLRLFSAM